MKMWRSVILPVHKNYNSEKSAYNWHPFSLLSEIISYFRILLHNNNYFVPYNISKTPNIMK